MSENKESRIENREGATPLPSPPGGGPEIRWKFVAWTVLAWLGLLAFLIYTRIVQYCTTVDPDNYESWPSFQILAGLYIWMPLLLPLLVLAQGIQVLVLRKSKRSMNGASSIAQ